MDLRCFRVAAAAVCWALAISGCGETPPVATIEKVCTPGAVYTCVHGQCNGHQTCAADGSKYTTCVCNGPSAGSSSAAIDAGADASAVPNTQANDAQMATREQCDNDEDDDADGHIDCDDSDCTEVSCVSQAPKGWQGPIALSLDAPSGTTCAGALSVTAFEAGAAPSGGPASCSACSCTGANSACAAFVNFGTGDTAGCAGTTCTTSINQACAEISPACLIGLNTAYLQTKLPSAESACTASPQMVTKPDAQWSTRVLACAVSAATRGGCQSASVCLPKSAGATFETSYCIWREGEVACPTGTFSHQHAYYRELSDTRGCTACACSAANCNYTWQVFNPSDTTCAAPLLQLTSGNQCVEVNPVAGKLRVGASISGDGKCIASGGVSQGALTAAKPVTVCCAP